MCKCLLLRRPACQKLFSPHVQYEDFPVVLQTCWSPFSYLWYWYWVQSLKGLTTSGGLQLVKGTQQRAQKVNKTHPEPCSQHQAPCSLNQMSYIHLKEAPFSNLQKSTIWSSRGLRVVLSCIFVTISELLITTQQLYWKCLIHVHACGAVLQRTPERDKRRVWKKSTSK